VIPVDGSAASEAAIELARHVFGGSEDGPVFHLIHVVSTPAEFMAPYLPEAIQQTSAALEPRRQEGQEYLNTLVSGLLAAGCRATTQARVAPRTAAAILEYAEEVEADAIVMATHGRDGVSRLLLGSIADKVVRGATRPILTARMKDPDPTPL